MLSAFPTPPEAKYWFNLSVKNNKKQDKLHNWLLQMFPHCFNHLISCIHIIFITVGLFTRMCPNMCTDYLVTHCKRRTYTSLNIHQMQVETWEYKANTRDCILNPRIHININNVAHKKHKKWQIVIKSWKCFMAE